MQGSTKPGPVDGSVRDPQDLEPLLIQRQHAGDVTTEVARRQADGSWLWVIDRYAVT